MKYKMLFAEFYLGMNSTNIVLRDPPEFLLFLYKNYPQHKRWINPEVFRGFNKYPDEYFYTKGSDTASNITGQFIKSNLRTPVTVIEGRCTIDKLLQHLNSDSYTHLGCSIRSNDLSNFIYCIKIVREKFPHIKIIAGNIGAYHKEVEEYTDYICRGKDGRGRGIPFLRTLFEEDMNAPYTFAYSPYDMEIHFNRSSYTRKYLLLITKTGCPHGCDFCATHSVFGGTCSGELVDPEIIYNFLVNYKKTHGNRDFYIHLAEPTAIIDKEWWYELFELFQKEKGDYPIMGATTTNSLLNLDLDRLNNSALRFELLNFGIENFTHTYNKNHGINYQELIQRYREYGINLYGSYIVGFPWQDENMIWEEMEQYAKIESSWWDIQNLKIYPDTSWWEKVKKDNLYEEIPHDFRVMHGFQAFRHDYFRIGFDDMWPLMYKINMYMEAECGPVVKNYYQVMDNLVKIHDKNSKLFSRTLKLYQGMLKELYPAWKYYFNPTSEQKNNFLQTCKIGS